VSLYATLADVELCLLLLWKHYNNSFAIPEVTIIIRDGQMPSLSELIEVLDPLLIYFCFCFLLLLFYQKCRSVCRIKKKKFFGLHLQDTPTL